MNILKKIISFLILTLILTACGGGESNKEEVKESNTTTLDTQHELPSTNNTNLNTPQPSDTLAETEEISEQQYFRVISPTSCTLDNENRFVYQVMHDSYLWEESVPELDYADSKYSDSNQLLKDLKDSRDHFSFIVNAKEAQSYFEEGKNDNFGFSIQLTPFDTMTYALIVDFVYPNSPADKAGIERGNIIIQVNHENIRADNIEELAKILDSNTTLTFGFWENNNIENKILSKESYDIKTILYSKYFESSDGEKHIGYMVFQDFIDNATQEIDEIFQKFKSLNSNELILDLRYNGGGSVDVARHLSSLIGGTNVSENIFHHVNLNDRYSKYNFSSYFEKYNQNALNLNRVFILTTKASCSASELVINALRASANNIEVVQIGDATCGKPYGFVGAGIFCDKALYAINMETKNSDNIGGYTEGLKPTCQVEDNPLKSFGDQEENLLATALDYISYNRCPEESNIIQKKEYSHPSHIQELPQDGFKRIMRAY